LEIVKYINNIAEKSKLSSFINGALWSLSSWNLLYLPPTWKRFHPYSSCSTGFTWQLNAFVRIHSNACPLQLSCNISITLDIGINNMIAIGHSEFWIV
jgi:hypothetical protein